MCEEAHSKLRGFFLGKSPAAFPFIPAVSCRVFRLFPIDDATPGNNSGGFYALNRADHVHVIDHSNSADI
jgi:hypothetical protein